MRLIHTEMSDTGARVEVRYSSHLEEYHFHLYSRHNVRVYEADYYTESGEDARGTARLMLVQHDRHQ